MRKNITVWILCLIMIISTALPASAVDEAPEKPEGSDAAVHEFVAGHIEEKLELEYPSGPAKGRLGAKDTYPEKYPTDGDYKKYATSVKNQGSNGLCWDFTATAAVESWLKKYIGIDSDFSEAHMSYAMSSGGGNSYGSAYRTAGGDDAGGNRYYSSTYLMRGMPGGFCAGGAVPESDDPYPSDPDTVLPERNAKYTLMGKNKTVMPQNILYLNDDKKNSYDVDLNNRIKDAVMKYGSVGAALKWETNNESGIYNETTAAHYRSKERKGLSSNHEILIVGWDDNYPASNFSETPEGNGAWRIKNSWGTGFGEEGYCWVSYYDAWFPSCAYAIDGVKSYDNSKERIYEYDYQLAEYIIHGSNMYLRYYAAEEDEVITDVVVFIGSNDAQVDADIICDMNAEGFDLDKYSFSAKGSVNNVYPGWYTIPLRQPVVVRKGKVFSAVIRTSTDTWIGEDEASRRNSGDYDGTWHIDSADAYGYCIKAKSTNDKEMLHRYGGHMFGDWTVTREAGCTETGSRTRTCSYCNYADTETIPPVGHSIGEWTITKEATCIENGSRETICPVCKGKVTEVIPVKDHSFGGWYTTAAATELAGGQETHRCTVCGAIESRATGTLAPTLPAVKISKPKAAKKSGTVKWKKISKKNLKRIRKIEIQYSTDPNFVADVKIKRVSPKKTSVKIKGLSAKKKYYVRLRGYANSGGEHVSGWSAVKSFKSK